MQFSFSKTFLKNLNGLPKLMDSYSGVPEENPAIPSQIQIRQKIGKESILSYRHFHNRYVLIVAIEGTAKVIIEDLNFQLTKNHGVLIFPHQEHKFTELSDNLILMMTMFDIISGNSELEPIYKKIFTINKKTLLLLNMMMETFLSSSRGDISSSKDMVFKLGAILNHILFLENDTMPVDVYNLDYSDLGRELLKKTLSYIMSHLSSPITISEIAKHLNVSESLLRNMFRDRIGQSLGKFIKYKRMNKAVSLLRSSEKNISSIALECGYSSVFTFSRAFTAEAKMSPMRFRKKSRM